MSATVTPVGGTAVGSVGARLPRKQDPRLLTGAGRYVDDVREPGMLYAAVLRSPHAHARIVSIDASRAQAMPGVVAVITGKDAIELSEPLPPTIDIQMKLTRCHAIATDRVRFEGEPVAAVAAVDRYVAEDALEAIDVVYEPLPVVATIDQGLAEDAPQLYEEWGDNVPLRWALRAGDADAALASAATVVTERFSHHRYLAAPLEARGVIASFDALARRLDVRLATQVPQQARTMLAATLRIPEHNVHVVVEEVGGGFGSKTVIDAEVIPCLLAVKTGRTVKWTETRSENLLTCAHARDYAWEIAGGFDADGRLTALRAKLTADVGCDGTNRASGVAPPLLAIYYLPGSYRVPVYDVELACVATNKAPAGALRGYGKDVATDGIERFLDLAAPQLGIDRLELRRRNFIQPDEYPYTQITGPVYDSGDVPRLLEMAREALDADGFAQRQAAARAEGRHLGIGFACMTEPSGGAVPMCIYNGYEPAILRVTPEGGVLLLTGLVDIGQGIETTLAQVVADELTIAPDGVRVVSGDTDVMPYGLGSWSSRGASYGVSAAVLAARKIRDKLLRIGAGMLETDVEAVVLRDGAVQLAAEPEKRLTIREIARAVYLWPGPHGIVPEGEDPGLEATAVWTSPNTRWVPDEIGTLSLYATHPTGCFGAIVEVDVETGQVTVERFVVAHDCGTVINPNIVEGQISGGAVNGIAGALYEELRYDADGHLLTRGFRDYLVPTAADVPPIEVLHHCSPSPFTPLGTKGMGEGGAIGSAPAIVNAVQDALSSFGVTVRELPLSPERVRSLLRAAHDGATPA
jgi:carbon-monoxide dehydrogenase large subunit